MVKTRIPITIKVSLEHADDEHATIKEVCNLKQETYVEVEVPNEIMSVFRNLVWGSNQLVISVGGRRGFPKPELVASE